MPEHVDLLPRFVGWLGEGGWLAFQVPGNFGAAQSPDPGRAASLPRWRARWAATPTATWPWRPGGYARVLAGLGLRVDAWETTYLHLLRGADPVLEWVKGTGLRPVLAALGPDDTEEFLAEYAARLRDAYPSWPDGVTPFPFRRVFVVAPASRPEPVGAASRLSRRLSGCAGARTGAPRRTGG